MLVGEIKLCAHLLPYRAEHRYTPGIGRAFENPFERNVAEDSHFRGGP
jgi:hypothetical protein